MKNLFASFIFFVVCVVVCVVWVSGFIIAKGFWSTFLAFFIPFWGWYLIIERIFFT